MRTLRTYSSKQQWFNNGHFSTTTTWQSTSTTSKAIAYAITIQKQHNDGEGQQCCWIGMLAERQETIVPRINT